MDFPVLKDLVIVFAFAMVIVMVFSRLKLPSLVGFLLAGAVVGPYGLGLVHDRHSVELLAEVGVVVLLFTVGIELSLSQLLQMGTALLRGVLQVTLTGGLIAGIAMALGESVGTSILIGCVVSLSSTAIVVRLLTERAETAAPHGRMALGVLILQDLAIVPMLLAVPFLAGKGGGWDEIGMTVVKAVAVVGLVLVVARKLVPKVLEVVIATRSRELFLLTIIVVALGTAWLTSAAGLSLGLGAFLAGLVVSESRYGHHAFSAVLPFQDAFSGLFFVSVGMLLDAGFLIHHPGVVLGATLGVLVLKALVVAAIAALTRQTIRIGLLTGLLIAQVGEFSFLLLHQGAQMGALAPDLHQLLIAVTVLTMAATPLGVLAAPWLAQSAADLTKGDSEQGHGYDALEDHVVIVGYGVNGENVSRALKRIGTQYVVLELNASTVDRLSAQGEPVLFGDATQAEALKHAGLVGARALVLTVPDAASARRTVQVAKTLDPSVHVIVRTRFLGEVPELLRLGADEVVPEEFETSIEIVSRILRHYLVPSQTVEEIANETRREAYGVFRAPPEVEGVGASGLPALLSDMRLEVFRIAEGSAMSGKTLAEAEVRRKSGALVLAVRRGRETTANPPPTWTLCEGDAVLVFGAPDEVQRAGALVRVRKEQPG